MKFNRRYILLAILILAVLGLFLPIKIHYSFEATALVYPSKEWNLKRGQDDSYISELHNNKTNVISDLKGYKFERGDIAELHLKEDLVSWDYISREDTIAYIHSYFIENEIIRLSNLIEVEQASMNVNTSGEKQTLIAEAEQEFEYAKQQLNLEEKNYNRQESLYHDSIISSAEFELYENSFHLAEINVQIAENELMSVKTGGKAEEIEYINSIIDSYTRELKTLRELKTQYYIKSPIDGVVSFRTTLDGVIAVNDTSNMILKIPVKVHNIQYLDRITAIRFSIPGYTEEREASFVDLDENVNLLSNQQMVLAKAVIAGSIQRIYPGMAVQCNVICDEITLLKYLSRNIRLRL